MTVQHTLYISDMVCHCCVKVLSEEFKRCGVKILCIQLGKAEIEFDDNIITLKLIEEHIVKEGFRVITDKNIILCERIKAAVIEMVHYSNNTDSIIRKSEYLIEKLGMSYQVLSKTFSKHEKITLEKFIILHKIERVKELIFCNEYSLCEIAFLMDFSSVHHLSASFKKVTGVTVSDFKKDPVKYKNPLLF